MATKMVKFTQDEWDAELKAAGIDTDPDPSPKPGARRLRHYWTRGEGAAKIRWGQEGDFNRCVRQLAKYVGPERAKGLCNVYHRAALGTAPGQGPHSKDDPASSGTDSGTESPTISSEPTETKGSTMSHMEYKSVGVNGLNVVDEQKGIVETFVSVTGIVDNVKDIIEPGAYEKSLNTRTPKGVWSHAWDTPVARTLDVKELSPGSPELPKTLPNGQPWPVEAGALKVKTQFNLDTQRGREAYSDVVFFGDQQEWSIGYQVPVGAATIDSKTGQRRIHTLELYEYSPVLFGAMPAARTASVKDAQVALKSITMPAVEFKSWMESVFGEGAAPEFEFKGGAAPEDEEPEDGEDEELFLVENEDDEDPESEDVEDEDEEDEDRPGEKVALTAYERDILVKTYNDIGSLLGLDPYTGITESKADDPDEYEETEASTLSAVAGAFEEVLNDAEMGEMAGYASDFDAAVEDDDVEAAQEAGNAILDMIEGHSDPTPELREAFQNIARAIADLAPEAAEEPPSEDTMETPETPEDEGDVAEKSEVLHLDTKELDAFRASLFNTPTD